VEHVDVDQIGRTPVPTRERPAQDFAGPIVERGRGLRTVRDGGQCLFESERIQAAACGRAKRYARADVTDGGRAFEQPDAEPLTLQRERRGEAAYPGAGNENGRRHRTASRLIA
jgi:hypothetical protein